MIIWPSPPRRWRNTSAKLFLGQGDVWTFIESPIAITAWILVIVILAVGYLLGRRN